MQYPGSKRVLASCDVLQLGVSKPGNWLRHAPSYGVVFNLHCLHSACSPGSNTCQESARTDQVVDHLPCRLPWTFYEMCCRDSGHLPLACHQVPSFQHSYLLFTMDGLAAQKNSLKQVMGLSLSTNIRLFTPPYILLNAHLQLNEPGPSSSAPSNISQHPALRSCSSISKLEPL